MLVTSSGKHTIPLSSRRQRNIPQGRKRGEFGIRPQEMDQATSASASHLCPTARASIRSLSSISSITQQHPPNHNRQTEATQILLPSSKGSFYSSSARNTPQSHSLSTGGPSILAPAGLLALCPHVCTTVGYSQAL